ncbi:MAG: amidohydrolase family protein [Gammaproteobacteria bacterium]|nr:amidohydrolase family protein [Gammaproteobacteria bacterium]
MTDSSLLIREAELLSSRGPTAICDVRIKDNVIDAIGELEAHPGDTVIDARGSLLIPGLHDHHAHLVSYAASLVSVPCGPPAVTNENELAETLNENPGHGWLRGTGYHESVLPNLDRGWLDSFGPDRPVRIQHRSGRLWIVNSAGLETIQEQSQILPDHERARLSDSKGLLYDVDELISDLTRSVPPPVDLASQQLARFGVTGINDMTPANDKATSDWFTTLQASGNLLQKVRLSGRPELTVCQTGDGLTIGETKVHLHDTSLPDIRALVALIFESHEQHRMVAVHCVTEVELVFALSAFRSAGSQWGDRIEHASVVPPKLIDQIRELELGIVTQPNFIFERGDAYLKDIPEAEHDFLYRCRSLIDAGIPVAFGTDMPFGHPDPWLAMRSAALRTTSSGHVLGIHERVSPEEALNMFLGELDAPFSPRVLTPGQTADCCLLDAPWHEIRNDFDSGHVRMTLKNGDVIYKSA